MFYGPNRSVKPGSVRWLTHFRVNSRQVTQHGPWDWLRGRGWLVSNRLAHLADLWVAIYIYIFIHTVSFTYYIYIYMYIHVEKL